MPKWISKVIKGQGRVLVPVDPAAESIQKKKDKQNGLITAEDLKGFKSQEKARVIKGASAERERIAAETAERERKYAAGYVPPAPRTGANAKFRERNARLAKNA